MADFGGAGDSIYRLEATFLHTGRTLRLRFADDNTVDLDTDAIATDESWGLYNVRVSVHGTTEDHDCDGTSATIIGTRRGDRLVGTAGNDVIAGLEGPDRILGMGGNDRICGGAGSDQVRGGPGSDRIFGEAGHDRIWGGPGNDRLWGGGGHDRLWGGGGSNELWGGPGHDLIDGRRDTYRTIPVRCPTPRGCARAA